MFSRCIVLSLFLASASAIAAPVAVRDILPVGDVVGDGQTEATVHVLVQYASGSPVNGLNLRATAGGSSAQVGELGGGLYAVTFTPEEVSTTSTVRVTVKGRAPELGPIDLSRDVVVHPAGGGAIQVTSNPPNVVLGSAAESTLSFSVPSALGQDPTAKDVVVRVSSGSVGELVSLGGGRFTARYTAPAVNYPHIAILTVADRRDAVGSAASIAIRLEGKVSYPVTATPGANVILEVAGREYGPAVADSAGNAQVPIVVPPGVGTATQMTVVDGKVERSSLDLQVPDIRRLQFVPLSQSVPSDARVRVPIMLAVLTPTGEPDPSAAVNLTTTAGQISRAEHVGDGLYQAEYTPPDGRIEMASTIQASVPGSTLQSDAMELTLTPAMPVRTTLSTIPETLSDETKLEVFAHVQAADGTGLPGRTIRFEATGGNPTGDVNDLGDGDYRADFVVDPSSGMHVRGSVLTPAGTNPLAHVVLLSSRDLVPADGTSRETLTVMTTDAYGMPVANVDVSLTAVSGGGSVPSMVTTDGFGYAAVPYTVGTISGLAELRATAEGHQGALGLLQGLDVGPLLPPSGTPDDMLVADALRATMGATRVRREAAADAVVATPPPETPSADGPAVSMLQVKVSPNVVAPGGTVKVKINTKSESGNPVEGANLQVVGDDLTFGTITELGGGAYEVNATASETATGPLRVSVVAPGGKPISVVELPVVGEPATAAGPWSTTPATTPETPVADATTEEPADEVEPIAPGPAVASTMKTNEAMDRPWFRLKGAVTLSSYSYIQLPGDTPGPLLPSSLGWGGESGRAAMPLGGEGRLRVMLPMARYIGFDGLFRASRYSVSAAIFQEAAADTLFDVRVNVIGRAPIRVGAGEFSVGARVGFRWDDFVTFRGCVDPGCKVEYDPLALPGLNAGIEMGFEAWKLFGHVNVDGGFAYGTQPYALNLDADLGIQITKNVFADLGFGWRWRTGSLFAGEESTETGSVSDQQFMGSVGVGVSL